MRHRIFSPIGFPMLLDIAATSAFAFDSAVDEFRIKRKDAFEFTASPRLK